MAPIAHNFTSCAFQERSCLHGSSQSNFRYRFCDRRRDDDNHFDVLRVLHGKAFHYSDSVETHRPELK